MDKDLFSVKETATYLQIRTETVLRKIYSGDIKASKVGREWRIKKADIDNYLEKNSNIAHNE